jgi:hypothetical protein
MSEASQQDCWYYTREGERMGPVTFAELRIQVEETLLNPRLDMVWTQGMAEWKPAGEIEGLFAKRPPPIPQESLTPPTDPYAPPKLDSVAEMMSRIVDWPGARRRGFLMATILFPLVWQGIVMLSSGSLTQQFWVEIMGIIAIGAMFVPVLVAIYFGLMRLVNLGMSRWWYLANFVPILNIWLGYRCFACPAGYAYHKKLDGVGVTLAIFYWLLVVLGILAIIVAIAMMLGALDNPELQQQLFDAFSTAREQATKP